MTSGACVNTAPRAQPRSPSRRLAVEQLAGLVTLDKITASTKELKTLMLDHGCTLMDLTGVCPVVAARILADVGDVARFADPSRSSSWSGTAPLDASSGGADPPPLSSGGQPEGQPHDPHRRAYQIRLDGPGRANYLQRWAGQAGRQSP